MDPKWLLVKVMGQKEFNDRWDVVIGLIDDVSYHLQLLLGAIKFIVRVHTCTLRYFTA